MADKMGDTFEIKQYHRRSELSILDTSIESYKNVKRGDCVVAFSRKRIFEVKKMIESEANLKCCVIYGTFME